MTRGDNSGRSLARAAALQMLYQWEVGRASAHEAIATYWPSQDGGGEVNEQNREFANGLLGGTISRVAEIDALLSARAQHWRVERMAVIDRLILRLAVYELLAEPDTPSRVVINEAIELARTFSGDESIAFVNGVLDGVRKDLGRE